MKTTAAVATAANADFTLAEIEVGMPGPGEVLVRIAGVGLCHTDLVFRDQIADFAKPAVLGHEGAGVVEAVGEGVSAIAVGDRVVLGFSSCGACARCGEGLPSYCTQFVPLNYAGMRLEDGSTAFTLDGVRLSSHFFGQSSFAMHTITRAANVVKVGDSSVPLALMGPLGCGFQTGAGAVLRALDCQPGSALVVFGGGPVGLAAVMAAKIRECAAIVLVEPVAARRQIGLEIGATHAIDPRSGDLATSVRDIVPEGVDHAFDTTGRIEVIEAGLACLASHGVLGLVGVPADLGAEVRFNLANLITFGHRIIGIIEGDSVPQDLIPELLRLHAQGRFPFDRLITSFPLNQINEAVAAQHRGDCIKVVLVPD
ncbi:MAG: hypothetical protein RIS94_2193 [Pseudomonadota bacterium]|jgi:aryl-alcohol dehydrogenase